MSLHLGWALSALLFSCTPLEFGSSPEAECALDTHCGPGKRCVEGFCDTLTFEVCDGIDNDLDGNTDEGLLNACMQCGPTPRELCNGLDDDCDGKEDETFENLGQACYFENEQGEDQIGLWSCNLSFRIECQETIGVSEEVCDGLDNDLNGEIDEGLDREITCTRFTCQDNTRLGRQWCEGGELKSNCDMIEERPDETCDGIDDDCDGQIDEDYVATEESCGVDSSCEITGQKRCEDGEEVSTCPEEIRRIGEECDGVDNDCDGVIDETEGMRPDMNLEHANELGESCNQGVCQARYRFFCQKGEQGEAVAFIRCTENADYVLGEDDPYDQALASKRYDWCGGGDEDCDGRFDEDSRPKMVTCPGSSQEGAFICHNISGPDERANYQHVRVGCLGNQARPDVCNGVDDDQDGLVDNGAGMCECELGWEDEPDLEGLDSNCDGLDGHYNGTVFVSAAYGDDRQGQGTAASPFATVTRAIGFVQVIYDRYEGREHALPIYVANGDYLWTPTTVHEAPLKLYGGYEVSRLTEGGDLVWTRPSPLESTGETILTSVISRPAVSTLSSSAILTLQRVKLVVPDRPDRQLELSNIGLILGVCDHVDLSAVHVQVGRGLPGRAGVDGSESFNTEAEINGLQAFGRPNSSDIAGEGGTNPACCSDASCDGGRGGLPNQNGQSGFNSGLLVDGLGGVLNTFTLNDNPQEQRAQLSGRNGLLGAQGQNATPPSDHLGGFSSVTYLWLEATDTATEASNGSPGSGGGGGAGSPPIPFFSPSRAGAGGGAGGCGGRAATNGSAGGWSVGVVLGERCTATIQELVITTGVAGEGGQGSRGGRGQSGYLGGYGAISLTDGYSGDGGAGGRGGCGGHGSSGHGGSSVGLVYLGDTSASAVTGVTHNLGEPGGAGVVLEQRYPLECSVAPSGRAGEQLESLCCGTLNEAEQRYTGCAPCAE